MYFETVNSNIGKVSLCNETDVVLLGLGWTKKC